MGQRFTTGGFYNYPALTKAGIAEQGRAVFCDTEEGEWRWNTEQIIAKQVGGLLAHPEDAHEPARWLVGDRLFICVGGRVYLVQIESGRVWSKRHIYRLKFTGSGYKLNTVTQVQLAALVMPAAESPVPELKWFGATKKPVSRPVDFEGWMPGSLSLHSEG